MTPPSSLTRLAVATIAAAGLWLSTTNMAQAQDPSTMNLDVNEGGTNTYSVSLNTQPDGTVTVTPTVTPSGTDVTTSGAVTFTVADWSTPRTITVTAANNDAEGDTTVTITHTVSGYGSVTTAGHVVVTVFDDDADTTPTFGTTTIAPQFYGRGTAVSPFTLPAARRGNKPVTYDLTGAPLPNGLTVDTTTRTLTGTPTTIASAVTYVWTASDRDDDTASLPFTITIQMTSVCGRSQPVREAIVEAVPEVTDCQNVTRTHLSSIPRLDLSGNFLQRDQAPRNGDFDGLSGLVELNLSGNAFARLPENLFNDLSALEELTLHRSANVTTLPAGIFNELDRLRELDLSAMMSLSTLPANLFSRLRTLERLFLSDNGRLTTLPAGLFNRLDALQALFLSGNRALTTLPAGLFSGLDFLNQVSMRGGGLTSLPEGLFDGMSGPLINLDLSGHRDPGGNPVTFTLTIDLEQQGDGQVRARVREAAPVDIEVDWMATGMTGPTTIVIPQGRRTSEAFGMPAMDSPADIVLSNPRYRVPGGLYRYTGLEQEQIVIASEPRSGVVFNPARLTVPENGTARYTVSLNTAPTGDVTLTPDITPPDSDVSLSHSTLTFTTGNWYVAQTVTVTTTTDTDDADDTATITYRVSGYPDVAAAALTVIVTDNDDERPDFGTGPIPPQTYSVREAIPTLTLPEATGGEVPLVYSLNRRSLPRGLTYIPATRTLIGTPTDVMSAVTLTWTATDSDTNHGPDDAATLTFTITVADAVPDAILQQTAVDVNEGGTATYTVALNARPAGEVTVTPAISDPASDVTTSGALTFSTTNWSRNQTITVTAAFDPDAENDTVTITHTVRSAIGVATAAAVTVIVDDRQKAPSFALAMATIADQRYPARAIIPTLTLPEATSGDGTLRYALTGSLPPGLTYTDRTRTLSGFPATEGTAGTLTWTVTDSDINTADDDSAALIFTVTIIAAMPGVAISVENIAVDEGAIATYTVLLATQPGGHVTITPTVSSPDGNVTTSGALIFRPTDWETPRTVTVAAGPDADTTDETVTITHPVTGYGRIATADPVTVAVTDTGSTPSFEAVTVADQTFFVDLPIRALTLPADAIGEDTPFTYTFAGTLPPGLIYTAASRTISGTPPASAAAATYTWTAVDTNLDSAALTFTITVAPFSICDRTPAISRAIVQALDGVSRCEDVTLAHLSTITALNVSTQPIGSPQVGDFDGLTSLTDLDLSRTELRALPAGVFARLSSLAGLNLNRNLLTSLPGDIFQGTDLRRLTMSQNRIARLPEGLFDQVGPFTLLHIAQRIAGRLRLFTLNINVEQRADGRVHVVLREAAPVTVHVDIGIVGGSSPGSPFEGVAVIPPGQRTSDAFGTPATSLADVRLSRPRVFFDPSLNLLEEETDDVHDLQAYSGFRLQVPPSAPSQVRFAPSPLTVMEEGAPATYTVALNTDPNATVTLTPSLSPGGNVRISPEALTFTPGDWHVFQTVTVTAGRDAGDTDDTVTIR